MRTYYTTAASTWGTQSYESYTGSDTSSTEASYYYPSSGSAGSSTRQIGESFYTTTEEKSSLTKNYSTTEICQSTTFSNSTSYTESYSQTFFYSDTLQTNSVSYSDSYHRSTCVTWVNYFKTYINLTGSSTLFSQLTSVYTYFDASGVTFDVGTYSTSTFSVNSSNFISGSTFTTYSTNGSGSTNVATTASFAVGSYQITVTASTTSETVTTTSLSSTRTYGSTSTGTNAIYTSTSLVGYTDNTVGISSFSTYTSSAASSTITVTFDPRVEQVVAYERGTAERMFALTSAFENTTKLLSEAVSEYNSYTESAFTVLTDTTSQFFNGLTSSSTTGSSSFSSVFPAYFAQLKGTYTVSPPSTDAYFGGYNQGTTSLSLGGGVFDMTYSNITGGAAGTTRFTQFPVLSTTYTATLIRYNPLIYLSFDSTTAGFGNFVLTYNTTSLANP